MSVSPSILLDQSNGFFHRQEHYDSSQDPQTHAHIVAVSFLTVVTMAVTVPMSVAMPMAILSMRVRLDGMGDQMEESITEQTAGSKGQQGLQPRLHLFRVIQRDSKENEERRGADQKGRSKRVDPDVEGVSLWFIL